MNVITIAGNFTKDAELRVLPDGSPVAVFSIADNHGKDKPAIFWNCSLFGKRAESLAQYIIKGSPATVTGNVSQRKYTDKDGVERTVMDVRVSDVALQGRASESAPRQQMPSASKPAASGGSGFDDMDDDIPFLSFSVGHDPLFTSRKDARLKAAR